MKKLAPIALAMVALAGCGEKFPEGYEELGFTRDGLTTTFKDEHSMTALYSSDEKLEPIIDNWHAQLEKNGYKQFCERKFDDKSVARGYSGKKRYLFTAGNLGGNIPELHLTEIPEHVKDETVCKDPDA